MGNKDSKPNTASNNDDEKGGSKKDNFLLKFRSETQIHSVDFMKIWLNYDKDHSGYIETAELEKFLKDLVEFNGKNNVKADALKMYKTVIMETFDINNDRRLEMSEMSHLLKVEDNFLLHFPTTHKLTPEEFEEIFQHYDTDKTGKIDRVQLMALLKDIWEKNGLHAAGKDLEAYHTAILMAFDVEADGKLSKSEVRLLLAKTL